jgi:hypothetical protein
MSSHKVSPVSSIILAAIFGGAFVTGLVVAAVWHFYAYGTVL